jgi:late competence protein required for DNA uptake (superfamily II DNA/RNA helicase)
MGAEVDFTGAAVPRSRGVERQPQSPPSRPGRSEEWAYICDRCGTPMEERHCKIVCPRCYYCRDCSDP